MANPFPIFNLRGVLDKETLYPRIYSFSWQTLSSLMKKAVNEGTIKGIKISRYCPTLSHLLFADDSIFFLDGKLVKCQNLAMILNQYCYATGQEINPNK